MQTLERVRDFLIEETHWEGPREELAPDLPLITERVVDSMTMLRLVAWLEEEFGISIGHTEVVPANFGSLRSIDALVERKLEAASAT
jgi:acyl carrier protein